LKEFGRASANHENGWYPMPILLVILPKVIHYANYFFYYQFAKPMAIEGVKLKF
jgi:hypothetical protein